MAQQEQLQDTFLSTLQREKTPVAVFLVNGIKLQGQIEMFDRWVVLLRSSNTQMIYKHTISTVVPISAATWNAEPSSHHRDREPRFKPQPR